MRPRPFSHERWELFFMRMALAGILILSLHGNWPDFTSMPKPHGLGEWIDFSFFGRLEIMSLLYVAYAGALLCFAAGFLLPLSLGYVLFFLVGVETLRNSQGAIGHSTQLLAMVVLAYFLVHTLHEIGRLRAGKAAFFASRESSEQAADWARNVIAAAYVVCGVVKLARTGGLWVWESPKLALQLIKTNEMDYYNRLTATAGYWAADFPRLIVEQPWLARFVFGTGFFIEILAFLVLLGKRWAFFGGLAIIAMHLSISRIMRLNFHEHMGLILILLVAPWPMALLGRIFQSNRES